MSGHIETLISRLKSGGSTVELVHTPHDRWPLASPRSAALRLQSSPVRVAVLDSSFNPPTLAHRALAGISSPHTGGSDQSSQPDSRGFDARLLLLSVRNADKALKPTDATYAQRLEMMILLAKDIMASASSPLDPGHSPHVDGRDNIAVGIIDEPTFVGKSRILRDFLQNRISRLCSAVHDSNTNDAEDRGFSERHLELAASSGVPRPQLTFVVGIDTLERILSPRYYSSEANMREVLRQFLSPTGDGSHLICARRVTPGLLASANERELNMWRIAEEYIDPKWVTMVDIGDRIQAFSSSEVRERIGSRVQDDLWKDMVIEDVAAYIEKEKLYTDGLGSNPTSQ
ncbi:hypothetical protein NM688_g4106 [Phlebia brevispora]|uniref:Uncharacterized protein n=1 Tax=Phlebia brevispora TaxID=194682 RepID=A0ACC1T405_9APHY|nr:hypothetical protein NM688_g4106 [Phlebia brevispora]